MGFLGSYGKFLKKSATFGANAVGNPLGGLGMLNQGGDPGKAQLAQALGFLNQGKQEAGLGFAQAAATQKAALPMVNAAFKSANQNAISMAESSKRRVGVNQAAQLKASKMQVDRAGFGQSNIANLAARGVYGDTAHAYDAIDQLTAQFLGGNAVSQANIGAGILGNVAGFQGQNAQAQSALSQALAQTVANVQHVPKKTGWDLLGAGMKLLPYLAAPSTGGASLMASGLAQNMQANQSTFYNTSNSGNGIF